MLPIGSYSAYRYESDIDLFIILSPRKQISTSFQISNYCSCGCVSTYIQWPQRYLTALCFFHFVFLYFCELKSHEQKQDSALTFGPFSPATPMTHAPTVAVRPGEIWTGRGSCSLKVTKAKAGWLTDWTDRIYPAAPLGCIVP